MEQQAVPVPTLEPGYPFFPLFCLVLSWISVPIGGPSTWHPGCSHGVKAAARNPEGRLLPFYCSRSASIGSTIVARRAGR
jgi:hypothetical protein